MAYTKREFRGPRMPAKDLSERWDAAVAGSDHFQQTKPTVTDRHYRRVMRQVLQRWVPRPQGLRVLKLDLYNEATGTTHTGYFVDARAMLVGIDISYRIASQAHRKCGADLHCVHGDVRELPFATGSFDLIFSLGTLEHVQDADQPAVLVELHRILRPGGRCVLGVNNRHSLWLTPLLFELLEKTGAVRDRWSYEPTYPPSHLKNLFHAAGFTDLHTDGTLLFPKWLRVYDMWSASRRGVLFGAANRVKDLAYAPLALAIEGLERWGKLNRFADQTLTIGTKRRA